MDTRTREAPLRWLVGGYVGISLLTVLGEAVASAAGIVVGPEAWTRSAIVLAVAVVTALIARAATRGSARAFLRLRILTAVQLVAVAVIVALPGAFPVWLRVEQAVCGLLLLGIVVLVNGPGMRAAMRRA